MRAVEGWEDMQSLTNKIRRQYETKAIAISTSKRNAVIGTRRIYSDSEPELSSSELDSEECSLSWA
jgi:hypothetical protein